MHYPSNLPFLEYLFKKFKSLKSFYILVKSIVTIPRIQVFKRLQPLVHFILSIQSYNLTSSSPDSNNLFQTSRLSEFLGTQIILKLSFNTTNNIYNTRLSNHIPILYSNSTPHRFRTQQDNPNFSTLMSKYHVLFDMKAGMSFPGLYALLDWRSWSRGYV